MQQQGKVASEGEENWINFFEKNSKNLLTNFACHVIMFKR